MKEKKDYTLMKYHCGYCNYMFKQLVRKELDTSSQVSCPRCKAFLKTWEDGETIQEYTGKPKKRIYTIDEEVK